MKNNLNKFEIFCNSFEESCVVDSDGKVVFNGNEDECINFRNIHQQYNDIDTEDKLIEFFIDFLKEDFLIEREVQTINKCTSKKGRIDLMLYPKDHLVEAGFTKGYFGVEVKYFTGHKFLSYISKAFYQSIFYANSFFINNKLKIEPEFVLLFSNLSIETILDYSSNKKKEQFKTSCQFAQLFSVGTINLYFDERRKTKDFSIDFGWRRYFSKSGRKGLHINKKCNFNTKDRANIQ